MNRKTIIASLLLLMLIGCASWQKTSAISYRTIGIALEHSGRMAKNMAAEDVISIEEGLRLREQYMMARKSYIDAGDILKTAIEMDEAKGRKEYLRLIELTNQLLNQMNFALEQYTRRTL